MGQIYDIGYNSSFTGTTVKADGTPWLTYYYYDHDVGNYTEYLIANARGVKAAAYHYGASSYHAILAFSASYNSCIGRYREDGLYVLENRTSEYNSTYGIYVTDIGHTTAFRNLKVLFDPYDNETEALIALSNQSRYPITYRLTNCTAPDAPTEAAVGSTVTVPFVFSDGYGIVNNENVYVTNNGVIVPSTYSGGVLTFEMPNPD